MTATIELEDENLKSSLLGLAVALIEIIKDTVKLQAVRRMENGKLSDKEIERLGNALLNLEKAVEEIKEEHAIKEAVKDFRDGLDGAVEEVLETFILQEKVLEEIGHRESEL